MPWLPGRAEPPPAGSGSDVDASSRNFRLEPGPRDGVGLGGETPPRSQLRLKPPGAGSPFSGLTLAFSTKRNMTTELWAPGGGCPVGEEGAQGEGAIRDEGVPRRGVQGAVTRPSSRPRGPGPATRHSREPVLPYMLAGGLWGTGPSGSQRRGHRGGEMAQSPSEQKRMAPWAMLGPGVRLEGQGWRGQIGREGAACSSDRPAIEEREQGVNCWGVGWAGEQRQGGESWLGPLSTRGLAHPGNMALLTPPLGVIRPPAWATSMEAEEKRTVHPVGLWLLAFCLGTLSITLGGEKKLGVSEVE